MKTEKKQQESSSLAEAREARLAVLEKIAEYEAEGGEKFFCDVENDPPSIRSAEAHSAQARQGRSRLRDIRSRPSITASL